MITERGMVRGLVTDYLYRWNLERLTAAVERGVNRASDLGTPASVLTIPFERAMTILN